MQKLTKSETLQALCRATSRYGMFIAFEWPEGVPLDEIAKAAPYLDLASDAQLLCDGEGFLLFDTEEELERAYRRTVGDDGPTPENPYDGPMRVYALTCFPDGELRNENT
jgi:hypothetical protein